METSGVVANRSHDGVLWAHNDSGGGAEVVALGLDGGDLGRVQIGDARNVHWEDIALLAGRPGEPDRLLVADIGDNPGGGSRTTQPVRVFRFDGPRDAEALLAEPVTGDAFLVSKQTDGFAAGVYRIPAAVISAPSATGRVTTLEREGDVAATAGALVTGGDISADGTEVVLRTYAAVLVWDRDPARSVAETLGGSRTCSVPVLEIQGEVVAVLVDGSGLVTVPEGARAAVLVRRGS